MSIGFNFVTLVTGSLVRECRPELKYLADVRSLGSPNPSSNACAEDCQSVALPCSFSFAVGLSIDWQFFHCLVGIAADVALIEHSLRLRQKNNHHCSSADMMVVFLAQSSLQSRCIAQGIGR